MTAPSDDRLDSWKEIAVFLKRGVRTVQRWERSEGLPVHRHQHSKQASVYAFKNEVSSWWASRAESFEGRTETSLSSLPGLGRSRKTRLLVLPFENLSGDTSQDYMVDGFTEEMITHLARLQREKLAVIARTTAMHYKGAQKRVDRIARELGVDYILEGSVRREERGIRVTAQLIRADDQTHLWVQTYDRDLGSVLALQAEVARAIASEIHVALRPQGKDGFLRGRRTDPAAYEDYLKGRYHLNRMTSDGLAQAVSWFQRAVARDPEYSLAYASLSHALALLAMVPFDALPPRQAMPQAASAARRALELDSRLPEAHAALGVVRHHYDWDWPGAEQEYREALKLNPEYSGARIRYAWLLLSLSRGREALQEVQRAQQSAQETDPHLLVVIRATRAAAFYFARDYERCIAECLEAIDLDPSHFLLHYLLARAQARKGAMTQAGLLLQQMQKGKERIPLMEMAVGLFFAVTGHKAKATAALESLQRLAARRYVPATYIGILLAGMGDREKAFEWLEMAYEERADGLTLLNVEPMVDALRKDVRFESLLKRLGMSGQSFANP